MTVGRNTMIGRLGGVGIALGIGAAVSCGAAGQAWASEDGSTAAKTNVAGEQRVSAVDTRVSRRGTDFRQPRREALRTRSGSGADTRPAESRKQAKAEPRTVHVTVSRRRSAEDRPESPVAGTALWTLVATARRDNSTRETAPAPPEATGETLTARGEDSVGDVTAGRAPQQEAPAWEQDYTGEPSAVHRVVTAGLKVLQVALKPVGGLLTFTSLRIPVFTDGLPTAGLMGGLRVRRTEFDGMPVWSLSPRKGATDKVVVAIHGGAYVGQVSIFHWWTYAGMARDTGATFLVPIYTLAPRGTAATEVPRMADFLTQTIAVHGPDDVSVLGDSAGGGLALATVQELVRRREATPGRLVLLAPWLDVSMSDPRSAEIDDPLLDIPNLAKAGVKWAGGLDPTDPLVSPLFGSLSELPPTSVYSSSRDLLTVDTLRLRDRVVAEGIPNMTFTLRKGLIHDFATFPFLPDAHQVRPAIYRDLLGSDVSAAMT